ncbi:hypothetical protein GBAR_LOCUS3434 [Geodia barretti]|uniref:Uncharacterized protein n=2 Tax=Geodia barretti TaxID=519541 RepID=A0AA35R4K6_GEOBA|nr:hypothetical protein GBAR_LOCUS3434 [Geodia barretti]
MSKLVPPREQGALFSVVSAVQVLSGTLAFVVYNLVYKLCLEEKDCPIGSPFWLMAILYFLTTPFLITLARFSKRSRRQAFVNSERFPPNPGSPTPHPTSPPIPTIHHPHHHNQTLAPHLHGNGYSTDDSDGMGGSIQWALSRSQSRRYQPPRVLSPASVGKDILERHSLIGRGRASSYGSHPHSINS